MSSKAMENALAEYRAAVPPLSWSAAGPHGFRAGWEAAMKFMASPRIPAQQEYNCPPGGIPLPPEELPKIKWSEKDLETMHRAGEEHNPHGLVAFYTDAP